MNRFTIDGKTYIGPVALTVSSIERSEDFYTRVLGLQVLTKSAASLTLGAEIDRPVLFLQEVPGAPRQPARSTGLYHFALLHPTRLELARSLRRLIDADWPPTGMSDHLVSESIYLDDPDGIGVELYRDRPRDQWAHNDRGVVMAVDPLDVRSLMAELNGEKETSSQMPAGMTMGHVHLRVSNIAESQRFYCDILGFDATFQMHSALFVSAGGYHHHLGLNTWSGEGAPPPPPHCCGLKYYTIQLPSSDAFEDTKNRLVSAGVSVNETDAGLQLHDPSHNSILIVSSKA